VKIANAAPSRLPSSGTALGVPIAAL